VSGPTSLNLMRLVLRTPEEPSTRCNLILCMCANWGQSTICIPGGKQYDRSRKCKAAGEKADQEASDNIEDSDFQEVLYDNHERHRCSYSNSVFARIAYDVA
ncbi:MAG: hypothetical protein L6R35_002322, partial [Caloplaca aegaea]